MRSPWKYLALGMLVLALLAGCAKQPTEELTAAQKAIEDAKAAGSAKYLPDETKKLEEALAAAQNEIKTQADKFFITRSYDKAKQMLAQVKTDAEKVKGDVAAKKEEAKKNALAEQEAASAAVKEAKALLAKAPKGKGAKADIEAMKADIKAVEDGLPEIQQLIEKEDYLVALDKAKAAKEKATGVANQIKEAMEKVKGKKK